MLYKIFSIVICILSISVSAMAQETSPVAVDKMVFCRGIQDRNPVGAATHFPDSVVRVFCYSRLTSSVEKTSISHVWYYNDTQMAIVDLPVNGSPLADMVFEADCKGVVRPVAGRCYFRRWCCNLQRRVCDHHCVRMIFCVLIS